jgi:hypothetical protein
MAVPVPVLFSVRVVMFLVITNEVLQGEPVVRHEEVDARVRPSPIVLIEIA